MNVDVYVIDSQFIERSQKGEAFVCKVMHKLLLHALSQTVFNKWKKTDLVHMKMIVVWIPLMLDLINIWMCGCFLLVNLDLILLLLREHWIWFFWILINGMILWWAHDLQPMVPQRVLLGDVSDGNPLFCPLLRCCTTSFILNGIFYCFTGSCSSMLMCVPFLLLFATG